jgi:hypothetical protein
MSPGPDMAPEKNTISLCSQEAAVYVMLVHDLDSFLECRLGAFLQSTKYALRGIMSGRPYPS